MFVKIIHKNNLIDFLKDSDGVWYEHFHESQSDFFQLFLVFEVTVLIRNEGNMETNKHI